MPNTQALPTHLLRNIPNLGESMSTQPKDRRRSPIRRSAALVTAVVAALAIAAPVAGASAATPAAATAPTFAGDTFNGPTAFVTSTGSAAGTVVGAA
jgi:hypothetical protein